jgi:hypothetical protein
MIILELFESLIRQSNHNADEEIEYDVAEVMEEDELIIKKVDERCVLVLALMHILQFLRFSC